MAQQPRTVPKLTQGELDDINRRMDSIESIFNGFKMPDPVCEDPCFDPCYSPTEPPERIPVGCCDDPWGDPPVVDDGVMVDFEGVPMEDTDGQLMEPFDDEL